MQIGSFAYVANARYMSPCIPEHVLGRLYLVYCNVWRRFERMGRIVKGLSLMA